MTARKLAGKSWFYDFTLPGHPRQRQAGYRTKAAAQAAEKEKKDELLLGKKLVTFSEAHGMYLASRGHMKARSRDSIDYLWRRIEPSLGHLFIEEISTVAMDALKGGLPLGLAPKTVNQHLIVVRSILRFAWKRQLISHVPHVPMVEGAVPREAQWYTQAERDRLLDYMYRLRPQWYLFFYLTVRLGLRAGEVYAIARSRLQDVPPRLLVDRAVQRGTREREAVLIGRKNHEPVTLDLPRDVVDAVAWHIKQGYAGPEFLFSHSGQFARYIDSHVGPLAYVQRAAGLRELGHHAVGRHSVASQAASCGESIKAIQAQLGHRSAVSTHRYTHVASGAQLRLVESLRPAQPPHLEAIAGAIDTALAEGHGNLTATNEKKHLAG